MSLTIKNAQNILDNHDSSKVTNSSPFKPKGEELFLYISDKKHKDDWLCDVYLWRNNANKNYPVSNSKSIKKIYFEVKLDTENGTIIKSNDFKNMFISTVTMKPMNLLY